MTGALRWQSAAIALLLVLAGFGAYRQESRPSWRYLSAEFPTVDGLYEGADVSVLGVPIGSVTSIVSHGTYVQVAMRYDASHHVPAGAEAVLVQPSIVGDRYVQLTPAYTGGPQLADHASLGTDRTQVPVTLDQTYASLNQLAQALAPDAAHPKGALADALNVASGVLAGNGSRARSTITDLSQALTTLADNKDNITGSIDGLAQLTSALADDDPQIRQLATNLAQVSGQLDSQRGELTGALNALQPALAQVSDFLAKNRSAVVSTVGQLNTAAAAVASQRGALSEVLRIAPLAVTNLDNAYNPQNWDPANPTMPIYARLGALQSRANFFNDLSIQLASALQGVCAQLPAGAQQGLQPVCSLLVGAGSQVGTVLQNLLGGVLAGGSALVPTASPASLSDLLLGGTQ